jgi:DNA-binding HxlR family transcriptional regulator
MWPLRRAHKRHIRVCIQEGADHMTDITPPGVVQIPEGGAVREVLDRIGDKWSLLIIGTLRHGPMRFGEIQTTVAGISQRMLTLTLNRLVNDSLVTRTAFPEIPPRVEYDLTELGRTLLPLVISLAEWAMAHHEEITASRRSM